MREMQVKEEEDKEKQDKMRKRSIQPFLLLSVTLHCKLNSKLAVNNCTKLSETAWELARHHINIRTERCTGTPEMRLSSVLFPAPETPSSLSVSFQRSTFFWEQHKIWCQRGDARTGGSLGTEDKRLTSEPFRLSRRGSPVSLSFKRCTMFLQEQRKIWSST